MTDWVRRSRVEVEPLAWGRATYTILRLPDPVAEALHAAGARRVEGEINEHPVNLALSRAPVVEGVFLWAGQSLLDRLGIAPGDRLEVRLRPSPDDRVETPPDVEAALRAGGVHGCMGRADAGQAPRAALPDRHGKDRTRPGAKRIDAADRRPRPRDRPFPARPCCLGLPDCCRSFGAR